MSAPVLHVITSTDRRGAEIFGVDLAAALVRRDRRAVVVALAPGTRQPALAVPTLGSRPLRPRTLRALRAQVRSAALVVAHGSTTLPACVLATAGTGVPFVYRNIGDPAQWASTPARRRRAGAFLRRARAVVALTPAVGDTLTARYRLDPERVRAIPTGVPAARFPPVDGVARRRARAHFGLPAAGPIVLLLGALSPEKDPGLAIDAVAGLDGVHLLIAGGGPEREPLEARAASTARGRVHFAGVVDAPQEALAAADAVVLSSRTEGLPAVLVEAGLSGLPAVATDVGWVRDVVVDGTTGFVVPSGRADALAGALRRALGDGGRLGAAARRHCLARYELEVVASAWDDLVAELTGVAASDAGA